MENAAAINEQLELIVYLLIQILESYRYYLYCLPFPRLADLSKHQPFNQGHFNVGPASTTQAQH